ncbi:MAG: hypothetical protein IT289_05180, partial [Oligoflexia bacterium]|nr:hypothetical protein [Oligoflexia bacterium]
MKFYGLVLVWLVAFSNVSQASPEETLRFIANQWMSGLCEAKDSVVYNALSEACKPRNAGEEGHFRIEGGVQVSCVSLGSGKTMVLGLPDGSLPAAHVIETLKAPNYTMRDDGSVTFAGRVGGEFCQKLVTELEKRVGKAANFCAINTALAGSKSDFNKSLETAMLIRECYVNYP